MNAQANPRGFRDIRRHIDLNITMQNALLVHPPGFTAQEQRFAVVLPDMQCIDHHLASMLLCITGQYAGGEIVHTRCFPAFNPRVRIDFRRFAHANVIIQRRAAEAIRHG